MKKFFFIDQKNEKVYVKPSEIKVLQKYQPSIKIEEEESEVPENKTRTLELCLNLFNKKGVPSKNFISDESFNVLLQTIQPVLDDKNLPKLNETVRQNVFYLRTIRETLKGLKLLGYEIPVYTIGTPDPDANEATPAMDNEATPAMDNEATPAMDNEATPAMDNEATPAMDNEATKVKPTKK